jgi:hypothetical protein
MSKKLLGAIVIVIIGGAVGIPLVVRHRNGQRLPPSAQTRSSYNLHLLSGSKYPSTDPVRLLFTIESSDGIILKDFETVHGAKLHLFVVRKDRFVLRHEHPVLDESSGTFSISAFSFPDDGTFRLIADYTPRNAQKVFTSFEDADIGDVSTATQFSVDEVSLRSTYGGLDTRLGLPAGDATATGTVQIKTPITLTLEVRKGDLEDKNLEPFQDTLADIVLLGPNLEYVHAYSEETPSTRQTGILRFKVILPVEGTYKVFAQIQDKGKMLVPSFVVQGVQSVAAKTNATPGEDQTMPGMNM